MQQSILDQAKVYFVKNRNRRIFRKIVQVLGCVVVFITTYALIIPAITMEQTAYCGLDEHTHSEACYQESAQKNLICTAEHLNIHIHSDSCYGEEGALICGLADYVIHSHDDSCLDENGTVICTLPERSAHIHTDSCYASVETQEPVYHTHTESCNISQKDQLICTLEESEGHSHGDACYEPGTVLLCTTTENHVHDDSCYTYPLVCNLSTDPHAHDSSCQGRGEQTCTVEEGHVHTDACTEEILNCQNTDEGHQHDGSCYTVNTICTIPENHTHGSGCYETVLVCGKTEGEAHVHAESCFSTERELTCTIPENHVHENSCYEPVLVCTTAEAPGHAHNDECYSWITVIGCGLEEGQEEPTEPVEPVLVCTEPAAQVHVHDDSCFEIRSKDPVPVCGKDDPDHQHTAECYVLNCGLEEHKHDLPCYSDPEADVESRETWERSFAGVELTGNWNEDVVAIAKTQLGYAESTRNYAVWEDNSVHGYTRYGAWYGVPYGDWCGMFASFCLNYARVEGMPLNYGVRPWIEDLSALGLYRPAEEYTPIPGDLVFFDWEDDGLSDHVGIVYEVIPATANEPAKLRTIEGNSSDCVQYVIYDLDDPVLLGYSMLPEKEEPAVQYFCGLEEHQHGEDCYGEDGTLICELIEHTHADECLQESKPGYLCGLLEHTHGDECLDENGEVVCPISEHLHSEDCLNPAEAFYCHTGAHSHTERCYDGENNLICSLEEHVHTSVCIVDLSELSESDRESVILVIQMIDKIPSADEIDAKIEEFEAAEDYEGEEAWLTEIYQEVAKAYLNYSNLREELQAYVVNRDKLLELEYIWSVATLAPATIWLDGTNGGMTSLYGSPDTAYPVQTGELFTLPTTWDSPTKHDYKLRGWYLINTINEYNQNREYDVDLTPNDCYYLPGATVQVTGDMVFYADWVARHYNIGSRNDTANLANTISTNDFITTHMFDYSSIFNMYSSRYTGTVSATSHSETWTALDHSQDLPNGMDSYGIILRDWDRKNNVLSKPNNYGNSSYPQFNTQDYITSGLMSTTPSPKSLFFTPGNAFYVNSAGTASGVLGTNYVGTADHLFQYDNNPSSANYGYYYYDSKLNAASFSPGRFYVYNYTEETYTDASEGGQFLPFNSPYINNAQYSNNTYEYDHLTQMSDSYSGTNFWFGMVNEIRFYLPNQSDPSGDANLSMQGKQMEFRFTGDDDVYVYVDNELVLDIGGIHAAKSGTINFSTGVVTLDGTTTTRTFEPGEHKLTMYYMERGSTMSNCAIYFNISPRFGMELKKVDPKNVPLTGSEFEVFMNVNLTEEAPLWATYEDYVADMNDGDDQYTQTTNKLVVDENGTAFIWGFSPGNTYYIKETVKPDNDMYILPNGLIQMQLDTRGNATYSAVVVKDPDSSIPTTELNPTPGYVVTDFNVDENNHIITITIQNSYPATDLYVKKVWEGVDVEPVPISVNLLENYELQDGTKVSNTVDTISLPIVVDEEEVWEYTWEELPTSKTITTKAEDGTDVTVTTEITYTVEEIEIPGFTTTIERVPKNQEIITESLTEVSSFTSGNVYLLHAQERYLAANSSGLYWTDDQNDVGAHWTVTSASGAWRLCNGNNLYLLSRSSYNSNYFYAGTQQGNVQFSDSNDNFYFESSSGWRTETYYMTGTISTSNGRASVSTSDSLNFSLLERTVTTTTESTDGFVITNTPDPDAFVVVKKEWLDWNGEPADLSLYEELSVTVNLKADGVVLDGKSVELNKDNNWSYTWEDLPNKNAAGAEIQYIVAEASQIEGWTCISTTQNEQGEWVITNQKKLNIPVEKLWQAVNKPDSIDVQLYAVYNESTTATLIHTITLQGDAWTGTFEDVGQLLKDKNLDTTGITFYVYEPTSTYVVEYNDPGNINIPVEGGDPKFVEAGKVTVENGAGNTVIITNYEMIELPSTGGSGTILYTAGGLLLFAAALFLLFYNRKFQISRS